MPIALAIHGGAGLIRRDSLTPQRQAACRDCLHRALNAGWAVLEARGSAVEATRAAVEVMELDPVFNAGKGAVLAGGGSVELDAAIMEGRTRLAGAITAARTPRSPVGAALAVLRHSPHVLLCAEGADAFIAEHGLPTAPQSWFVTPERRAQYEQAHQAGAYGLDHGGGDTDVYGTVGAVATDAQGDVAAATSTGGMVNKRPGRVGDTPLIGSGTYAWNHTAAVSGTGHGEPFIRLGVAGRVSALMELAGLDLAQAAHRVIFDDLPEISGQGGLIAVDRHGNIAMPFNTGGMFRGQKTPNQHDVGIW